MNAATAKQAAKESRVIQAKKMINEAVQDGLFQIRKENLLPEQIEYFEDNGYKVIKVQQRDGICYDINWE